MSEQARLLLVIAITAVAAIVVFVAVLAAGAKAQERVDSAIVLAADMSSSMSDDERAIARESHARAITSREVLDAIEQGPYQRVAFAYVEFGSRAEIVVNWTLVSSSPSAEAFAQRLLAADRPNMGSLTCIACALDVAAKLLSGLPYEPLFRTVDVAGDGKNNQSGTQVAVARAILLDMGATINGLPMTLSSDATDIADYYANEIIGGPRAFSIELRDINDMPMLIRRKLVLELGAAPSDRSAS